MNQSIRNSFLWFTGKTYFRVAILFCFVLGASTSAKAQLDKGSEKMAGLDGINYSPAIKKNAKASGSALIHTQTGKFKLYATYKNKQVIELYAIDNSGKRIAPTFRRLSNSGVKCEVCVYSPGGVLCYPVDCSDLPKPKGGLKFE